MTYRPLHAWILLTAALSLPFGLAAGCSGSETTSKPTPDAGTPPPDDAGDAGATDAPPDVPKPPSACELAGLPERPFAAGPYGTIRHEIAGDFSIDLTDGTTWRFQEQLIGCESYLFVPDTLVVSDLDPTSIWESDLDALLKKSPKNVHYFFVSRAKTAELATASTDAMTARVAESLAKLKAEDAEHWKAHVHVAAKRAADIPDWPGKVLVGHGRIGFGIDRFQRVRGFGLLADVSRYDDALQQAMKWPWKANLAYAMNEAVAFNAEVDRQAKLDAENATVIPLWKGDVLEEFAETDVDLPSAEELKKYDTLEIEVEMRCPNPNEIEFGNCGAWDYIAALSVPDAQMKPLEIARFITSYHRETHWVVDASPMLVLLAKGGKQHFRWDFAPNWNKQPTATQLSLRLSNQGKGYRPAEATFLWAGGGFNAMYDTLHPDVMVPIPADAKRVELWAIITGHGSGTNQCSEFCNHQHDFSVNGKVYRKEHKEANTSNKCMPHMENGMVPNQGGTWWFGRGGWCPGQQVDPWVVDVTADVTPGTAAALQYKGLYKGLTPPDGSGDIVVTSYLVVYK